MDFIKNRLRGKGDVVMLSDQINGIIAAFALVDYPSIYIIIQYALKSLCIEAVIDDTASPNPYISGVYVSLKHGPVDPDCVISCVTGVLATLKLAEWNIKESAREMLEDAAAARKIVDDIDSRGTGEDNEK